MGTRLSGKVLPDSELMRLYGRPRQGRLVFTNGCFELLHPGHVACLTRARELGDALVVAVNSDESAERLGKGPGRPLVSAGDRAGVVAALACVDAVCLFDEDTPLALVSRLLPDVLVKGGDYAPNAVVGGREVEQAGGAVVIVPFLEGYSTTELVQRIRETST